MHRMLGTSDEAYISEPRAQGVRVIEFLRLRMGYGLLLRVQGFQSRVESV